MRKRLLHLEDSSVGDLSLPEWNAFIQLIRNCLDEPLSTSIVPLILKEIAFEFISSKEMRSILTFSTELVKENPQAARFFLLTLDYICKVAKLPPEFYELASKRILTLQL